MHTRRLPCLFLACLCFFASSRLRAQTVPANDAKQQIAQVLQTQSAAWNAGDIPGFMVGYAQESTLRFASGGTVTYGWQETLDRYKQHYPDPAAMGKLTFSDLDITVLSPDAALAFGRWRLKNDHGEPNGLFTLLFRKQGDAWRIVADHTSSANP